MPEKVTCKEVMNHICESLGEELDSPKCVAIKQHLDDCPECKNYFKTVELTIDLYKKYDIQIPEDAHNRLISFLKLDSGKDQKQDS